MHHHRVIAQASFVEKYIHIYWQYMITRLQEACCLMYGDVVGVKGKEVEVEEKPPVEGIGIEVKASSRVKSGSNIEC